MSTISSRFWRFALVNLFGIIAVAVAIAALYRYVAFNNFKDQRRSSTKFTICGNLPRRKAGSSFSKVRKSTVLSLL